MSRVLASSVLLALLAVVAAITPVTTAAPAGGDTATQAPQSDVRVALTLTLEGYGLSLSNAHEIVLLATDGVLLDDAEQTCTVRMVTMFWCEAQEGGGSSTMMMHFRMDESCFHSFLPSGQLCLSYMCPEGSRRMFRMKTGSNYCYGMPKETCVYVTFSDPVPSTCDSMPDCECLPDLAESSCSSASECVPVVPTIDPEVFVPTECPTCP